MGHLSHKWRERAARPLPWFSRYSVYSLWMRALSFSSPSYSSKTRRSNIRREIWYCLRQDKPGSLAKLGEVYSFFGNFRCNIGTPTRAGMWKSLWKSASKTCMSGLKADTLADRFRTAPAGVSFLRCPPAPHERPPPRLKPVRGLRAASARRSGRPVQRAVSLASFCSGWVLPPAGGPAAALVVGVPWPSAISLPFCCRGACGGLWGSRGLPGSLSVRCSAPLRASRRLRRGAPARLALSWPLGCSAACGRRRGE